MKKNIILLAFLIGFNSCEKGITFDLNETAPKLVVEATIENDQAPMVILSQSLDFFSTIDPEALTKSFVHGAEIYISDGTKTHKLKEYAIPVSLTDSVYYYSNNPADAATFIIGKLNKQYTLRIAEGGKEYTSVTNIPGITRTVEQVSWKQVPDSSDTTKVTVLLKATDRPGLGDYVRYFTKRNDEPFYPGLNSVFDDQIIDGKTYEVEVPRGVNRNDTRDENSDFFERGDTVTVKLCNIDKATYDFWRTMEYSYQSIGNPFSSPTKITGNISNGALGYFGGYAAQFHTIIIPE